METKNIGLRGIEVADTKISNIDGDKGKLIYRGFDILDLTKNSTFEETAYLLIYDNLPTKNELNEFNKENASKRVNLRLLHSDSMFISPSTKLFRSSTFLKKKCCISN